VLPLTYPTARKKVPAVDQKWLADLKTRAEGTAG
jgi:hypothetical protein